MRPNAFTSSGLYTVFAHTQHLGAVVTDAPILAAVVDGLLAPDTAAGAVDAAAALAATAASFAAKAALTDDGDGVELADASTAGSAVAVDGTLDPAVDPVAFNILSTDLLIFQTFSTQR